MTTKKWYGIEDLEKEFGPPTFAGIMRAFRWADGATQTDYAKRLKLSRANLCDIEKGRKFVSLERAAKIAKMLGVAEKPLIQLALQDSLRSARLKYMVELKEVS